MDTTTHHHIQLLPEHIIDQIKAGEVIERPSTLIKEVLENSIDAQSTKIDLHIVENGLELIAIKDNGVGIPASELSMAFCRHATSKISQFEDIYRLSSFGFRGEALASIASISKINCSSKTAKSTGQLKIQGGEILLHEEVSEKNSNTGTELYIKELFYNTPVRMKFIQSKTSEKNHINRIIRSFLLTNPHIEFSIKWDQNEKEIFQKKSHLERIQQTLFKNRSVKLVSSDTSYDGIQFNIFLSQESSRGNAHKQHYLFINNRFIQDIQIHKIILNSAKNFWPDGETGHYVAQIFIPRDEIDANVHPNKTIVKLFNAPKIYSIISGTIKSKIISSHEGHDIPTKTMQALPLVKDDSFEKLIQYKEVDFTQEGQVSDYIEHIHEPAEELNKASLCQFTHLETFGLIIKNKSLYLFEKSDLLTKYLNDLISELPNHTESIPLLVSRPLKISHQISQSTEEFVQNLGFEFDYLEKQTLVLRSFPKMLQHMPYIYLLERLLASPRPSISELDSQKFSAHTIEKIVSDHFDLYIQEGLIQKIKERELQRIYVFKK